MATLVFLQKDLRLYDNPALYNAAKYQKPIIVAHVMEKRIGSASKWWLSESLKQFRSQLEEYGLPLLHLPESDKDNLNAFMDYLSGHIKIDEIYSNGLDFVLPSGLENIHQAFMTNLIFVQEEMTKEFKVFTPFWKFICTNCTPVKPVGYPNFTNVHRVHIKFSQYNKLPEMSGYNWWSKMAPFWKIGEKEAQKQYKHFVETNLANYDRRRDFFCEDSTSKLSPHLRFGEISVRQIYYELNTKRNERFCAELGWREFAYHVLKHHPDMNNVPLNTKFKDFWPKCKESYLKAWKQGQTGFPVIDAAMRELWATGWMHNRLRMLVASFLVKNLLIPWQTGEEWFYECLVDADVASNPFNWQWVAGCGTDSVPYFRIFNPMLQGEKFDCQGKYVRQWIPELQSFPMAKNIHQDIFKDSSLRPKNYPKPIIDFKVSREKALATMKAIVSPKVSQLKRNYKSILK